MRECGDDWGNVRMNEAMWSKWRNVGEYGNDWGNVRMNEAMWSKWRNAGVSELDGYTMSVCNKYQVSVSDKNAFLWPRLSWCQRRTLDLAATTNAFL